jgi:hypothetical protein
MEVLKIEGGDDTPSVVLDKENGLFEISGRSIPEDILQFYNPVLDWLDGYAKEPLPQTVFNFKLEYYNTASSRMLLDILLKLEDMYKDGTDVMVKWYYPHNDGDIEDGGRDYFELVKVPHEILPMVVSPHHVVKKPVSEVEEEIPELPEEALELSSGGLKCPFCGSENVSVTDDNNFAQKVADIFMSILGSKQDESREIFYKCEVCGKKWNDNQEKK